MTMGSRKADPDVIAEVMKKSIGSQAGREALASSMTAPIRRALNTNSVARSVFTFEQLSEPCGTCRRTDPEEGYGAGCTECTARSVMET